MMNKTLISTAFAAVVATAAANASISPLFIEDWSGNPAESGWTIHGSGKTPSGTIAGLVGTDGWQLVEFPFGIAYLASTSTTTEGGKVNCRLVSPAIDVPSVGAVLSLDAVNWNPDKSLDNKLSVYVVADGEEHLYDEAEPLYSKRIPANNYPSPVHIGLQLAEWKGFAVRVVIVNEGNDCGLLGIGDVTVAAYDARLMDTSALYLPPTEAWRPRVELASASCFDGYSAILSVDGEPVETVAIEVDPEAGYAAYAIPFTTSVESEGMPSRGYEVELAPVWADVPSISLKGSMVFGGGFPGVVVEEEGTGEQCGNCPYGAAGLARFSDLWPERFFGIAIHCTDQFSGMAMRAPGYSLQFEKNPANPMVALPSALLNRKTVVNPSDILSMDKSVTDFLASESPVRATVGRVDHDPATAEVKVAFSVESCADLSGTPLCAAVVLTADGLRGSGPEWTQTNYLSGAKRPDAVDDSWWDYLRFYFEYPSKYILSADYQYDHVALGIYPDFKGEGMPLASEMRAGVPAEDEIRFTMPMQEEANGFGVQDPAQTSVTLIVMDSRTGEILTATRVDAGSYNKDLSGVDRIGSEGEASSRTCFYDLSGRQIDPVRCESGIYIRKTGNETRKIIIR